MKVGIIGAGAMGCLFAAKLSKTNNEALLIDREAKTIAAIRRKGVEVKEDGRVWKAWVPIHASLDFLEDSDLVLVMVKAYSTKSVARELRGRLNKSSIVLTLQNGLGNLEVLTQNLGRRVLAGSTTEASLRILPGLVEHTGHGLTLLGELDGEKSERASKVIQVLRAAGFESKMTRQVQTVVWSKAVLNSAINPVSALTRLRNGRLHQFEWMRDLMKRVLEEGVRVARAEGIALRVADLSVMLSKVLATSARNRSSMLQDVLNGRRTEVRELNGAISKFGAKHGIPTPINKFLSSLVISLEASYL